MPFEVPEGWCWCQFGEFLDVRDGTHDSPKYVTNGVPFVTSKNLKNGEIDFSTVNYISEEDHLNFIKRSKVDIGDILFAMIGSIGNPVKVKETKEFSIKNVALFKPFVKATNMDYVLLFLLYVQNNLQTNAKGGMQPFIPLTFFRKDLYIPLPPEKEQEAIVTEVGNLLAIVDWLEDSKQDLSSAISQAKSKILDLAIHGKLVPQDANDEPASELLKRINPKAVASCDNPHYAKPYELPNGWTWCKLADLCTFLSRGKSPKYSDIDTTYPVFAQKCNLKEGGISLEKAQFLDPSTLGKWPKIYHLRTGDILVNSTGTGTVGRTRLFDDSCLGEYAFVVPDSHVSVIRTYNEIVPEYIFALMSSSWIQTYIADNLAGSTNQKELYIGVLHNIDVPLPPITEQRRIADKIESLNLQLDNMIHLVD